MQEHRKAVMLHLAAGTESDFCPRATFCPDAFLFADQNVATPLSRLLDLSLWGGWSAHLYDVLAETNPDPWPLIVPTRIAHPTNGQTLDDFIQPLKRSLISVRKRLLAEGAGEIRTGTLLVGQQAAPAPLLQSDPESLERFATLGFQSAYAIVEDVCSLPVGSPFHPLVRPGSSGDERETWARALASQGYFRLKDS